MSREHEPRPDQQGFHLNRPTLGVIAIGAVCLVGGGIAGNHIYETLGNSGAGESLAPLVPTNPQIDAKTTIVTWNVENRLGGLVPQIRKINNQYHPDAFVFQEGSVRGAYALQAAFPKMHVLYRVTDGKYNFENGGQALVAMSPQPMEDENHHVFPAPSLGETAVRVLKGLRSDATSVFSKGPGLDNAKKAPQENRLAMAFTIKAWIHGELKDIRVVTSHVTPTDEFQGKQLGENIDFVNSNDKEGRPTVFCDDANEDPPEYIPKMAEAGFITPETGPTSHDGRTIDYCSYKPGDNMLGLGEAEVLTEKGSDHFGVVITFETD